MKVRTIEKVLDKKISEWINSIDDIKVRDAVKKDTIVTGGSIASMLINEKVNDFDIYFRNKSTVKLVSQYYANKTNGVVTVIDGVDFQNYTPPRFDVLRTPEEEESQAQFDVFVKGIQRDRIKLYVAGMNYYNVNNKESALLEDDDEANHVVGSIFTKEDPKDEVKPYSARIFTSNAITLTDQIQLVIRFHGEPEELHKNYDFVHATNYYDHKTGKVTVNAAAMESLLTRELRYIGSLYPVTSIIRTKKFINRSWRVSAGTYMKIMFQVSQLDLTDPVVLEEQLAGVDVAYFSLLIEAISKVEDKSKLNYEWLSEVIDRIFN